MKLLVLSTGLPATGNATTAGRICGHFHDAGHEVTAVRLEDLRMETDVIDVAEQCGAEAAIGIHAFGSGRFLRHLDLPTVIIFGGTDMNEDTKNPERMAVMTEAVRRASALVIYTEQFRDALVRHWPDAGGAVHVIPQGVQTCPSNFSLRREMRLAADDVLFLLPSGLRPVKDPLFCAEAFSRWHRDDPRIRMVIAGAVRDPAFARLTKDSLAAFPGVAFHDALSRGDMHAAMREAAAVLNTSRSECSPNAVLEAMALGTPVIARDIPGNRSIVEHGKTGLLFSTPEECRRRAAELLGDARLRESLVSNAKAAIRENHSVLREARGYAAVLDCARR